MNLYVTSASSVVMSKLVKHPQNGRDNAPEGLMSDLRKHQNIKDEMESYTKEDCLEWITLQTGDVR
jgi:hypothetical protein